MGLDLRGNVVVRVRDGGRTKDEDVIQHFRPAVILRAHAFRYCHHALAGFTREGLRPNNGLAERFQQLSYEWRFARVSATEVLCQNLVTGDKKIVDQHPRPSGRNGRMEHVYVQEYLRRRLRHPRHRIFGAPGREVWYGGRTLNDLDTTLRVWDMIQTLRPDVRITDHLDWWPSHREIRGWLWLGVDADIDTDLGASSDGQRIYRLPWQEIVSIDHAMIRDQSIPVYTGFSYRLSAHAFVDKREMLAWQS